MAPSEAKTQARVLKDLYEHLISLRAGGAPKPEDYEPWLKKLSGLGLL